MHSTRQLSSTLMCLVDKAGRLGEAKDLAAPKCCQYIYRHNFTSFYTFASKCFFVKLHVAENGVTLSITLRTRRYRLISKFNSYIYVCMIRDFSFVHFPIHCIEISCISLLENLKRLLSYFISRSNSMD